MPLARRHKGPRGGVDLRAEINVTSLVDVAFTLLVIFIITAPIMQGGVEVAIPRADVPALRASDQPFFVSFQGDGTVYVGETPVSVEDFSESFPQLLRAANTEFVYIRGDSLAGWGTGVQVIAIVATVAKELGIPYGIVAEPDANR
jgi:biopolymer transport protein TolR